MKGQQHSLLQPMESIGVPQASSSEVPPRWLDPPPAMEGVCAAVRILTMQMRHLYRSPRWICLSSSLIRAFRASMVVAVDSSSVTLVGGATVRDTGWGGG